jgi:hypothetical protein
VQHGKQAVIPAPQHSATSAQYRPGPHSAVLAHSALAGQLSPVMSAHRVSPSMLEKHWQRGLVAEQSTSVPPHEVLPAAHDPASQAQHGKQTVIPSPQHSAMSAQYRPGPQSALLAHSALAGQASPVMSAH